MGSIHQTFTQDEELRGGRSCQKTHGKPDGQVVNLVVSIVGELGAGLTIPHEGVYLQISSCA